MDKAIAPMAVLKLCFLHTSPGLFDHKHLVFPAVLKKKIRPDIPVLRCAMDLCHIFFDHLPFLDGLGQSGGSGFGAGVHHHTAHIFIQPVQREDLSTQAFFQRLGNLGF